MSDPRNVEVMKTQIRAWVLPIVISALISVGGIAIFMGSLIWQGQQNQLAQATREIESLKTTLSATQNTLALVGVNQQQSTEDRKSFEAATEAKLDILTDTQVKMGLALERQTVILEQLQRNQPASPGS